MLLFAFSFFFTLHRDIFEQIARLTVECPADAVERFKSDRFGFFVFQNGDIGHCNADAFGKLRHTHSAFGEHDVQSNSD